MKLVRFSVENSLLLNIFSLFVIVAGITTAISMRKEAFPAVDFDIVSVSTVYPGASSREVEEQVTNIIEKELKTIDGLDEMTSSSVENLSVIVVKLDPDRSASEKSTTVTDIQRAVDRIRDLPDEILEAPLVNEAKSGDMPVLEVALSGDLPYRELHRMAEEITDHIEQFSDASRPQKVGFREREYWIEINRQKLATMHLDLSEVISSLRLANLNLPGGILKTGGGEYLVRTIGEVDTVSDLESIILRTNSNGITIRIGDVGRAVSTFEDLDEYTRANGHPSINLIVKKKPSGDILKLVDEVKDFVDEYRQRPENQGLHVDFYNDISRFVVNRLSVLVNNGVLGVILVMLSLLFFLSRGIAFVTAIGMPLAFLGAIMVMNWLGMTINLLSMFALVIVLGMLVDDAIIVAENIWQHYEMGKSPIEATIDGTKEVFFPVTATILTSCAAFSPLLMVSGIFGKFIETLPKVVIVCLAISLIEAMIILPCHVYDMLILGERMSKNKKKIKRGGGDRIKFAIDAYGKLLEFTLRWRYGFFLFACATFGSAMYVASNHMKTILFPTEGVEAFFVRGNLANGSPASLTEEKMKVFERVLHKRLGKDELQTLVTNIGLQQTDPMDPFKVRASHVGQVGVYLSPEKDRERSADAIIADIRDEIEKEGHKAGISHINFVTQRMGPPVGKPVAVRVQGHDLDQLVQVSELVQEELKTHAGVSDVDDNFMEGKRELRIEVDNTKAADSMLTTQAIALNVRAGLEGHIASHAHHDGERIPIRVRFRPEDRTATSGLESSMVGNHMGQLVKLSSVANIVDSQGISAIIHREGLRTVTVTASLDEKVTDSSTVNQALGPKLTALESQFPGVQLSAGGEYEETNESVESMLRAFGVAIALIFIILASQFKSLTQPFVLMAAIPFGLIGVIASFFLHGLPISFLGMVGMIGLTGVVVNDSIVLVDFINKARQRGMSAFEAAVYAGKRRFRAVWLTSITTIFGLLPLAYGIGGDDMFLRPAAMALGYGLLFATVLILLLVPAMYLIRHDMGRILYAMMGRRSKTTAA